MLPVTVVKFGDPEIEPSILIAPVLVRLIVQPVVPVVISPEMVSVPVDTLIVLSLPVVVAFIVSEPAVKLPAFTLIVPVIEDAGLGMVISPVTVREFVPLIVKVLFALIAPNVRDLHAAPEIFTVNVIPELIITSSLLVGVDDPPHVVVLFQFPDTDAVLVAAWIIDVEMRNEMTNKVRIRSMCFFILVFFKVLKMKLLLF